MENVNHPQHYEGSCSIECIDAMEMSFGLEATLKFAMINAYKYMWRYKQKNGKEDLEKADWYLTYWLKNYYEWYDSELPVGLDDYEKILPMKAFVLERLTEYEKKEKEIEF